MGTVFSQDQSNSLQIVTSKMKNFDVSKFIKQSPPKYNGNVDDCSFGYNFNYKKL